jgi:dethiobiotin synthetase
MTAARVCPEGVFVVGTDTGVGKTLVAAAVARMLRKRGVQVGVFKPFLSGDPQFMDAQILARAAGMAGPGMLPEALLDVISPNRFLEPLSPGMAARREGRSVNLGAVLEDARALGRVNEALVVEGAGGLMVPLTEHMKAGETVLDLVATLGLPALLVGRTALGTINHTSLSVMALKARGIRLGGLVLNQTEPQNPGEDRDLMDAMEGCAGIRPLCTVPFTNGSEAIQVGTAARLFEQCDLWSRFSSGTTG